MLWTTEGGKTGEDALEFASDPEELETELLPYDILTNIAHSIMLKEQGYMEKDELEEVLENLSQLYKKSPEVEAEDVHTFVEEYVTERSEAGKKIHTGRSRNDQVVTDTRLMLKDSCIKISEKALELVGSLEKFTEEENVLMPGYTHQRMAMPSSTGLWASSYIDMILDDLKSLKGTYLTINSSPLGAAAGYGTSLNINRERTAELLGFSEVQENPVYCVNRGKHELMVLQNLDQFMVDIGKLCEDLITFSMEEKPFFKIPEEFCTGSSIMPQKSNPDVLEIARAKTGKFSGKVQALRNIVSKLPHGYNRDTQETKKLLLSSIGELMEVLDVLTELVKRLKAVEQDVDDSIFAAYTANKMVESGTPFRDAYRKVKESQEYEIPEGEPPSPEFQDYSGIEEFWSSESESFSRMKKQLLNFQHN